MVKSESPHRKSKHIEIRCHFIRQLCAEEKVALIYVPTELQLADLEAGAQLDAQSLALAADPTDRRADNDVGGLLDPNKGWRLTIPDPVTASASYNASLAAQTGNHRVAMSANGDQQGDATP